MKRAKKKKLKRIVKASMFALVMATFSGAIYFSQVKSVDVDYLGDKISFKTMANTVSEAFEEKMIIISEGLVVSKDLNSELSKSNEIFIDAPQILAMNETAPIEEEKPEIESPVVEPIKEEPKVEVKKAATQKATSRSTTTPRTWYNDVKEVEPGVIETADGKAIEYTNVLEMEATAYCACYSCCGKYPSNKYYGVTKTGTRAKVGTIAVDPRKIPLGSELYIEGLNGAKNYGYGKAEDIGGAIKGNIVDLFFDTHSETVRWGRQQVKVYILKK